MVTLPSKSTGQLRQPGRPPHPNSIRLSLAIVDGWRLGLDGLGVRRALLAYRRPSIVPEKLLRALLLQVLYTIRSRRQLMEQLDYHLLFR